MNPETIVLNPPDIVENFALDKETLCQFPGCTRHPAFFIMFATGYEQALRAQACIVHSDYVLDCASRIVNDPKAVYTPDTPGKPEGPFTVDDLNETIEEQRRQRRER